MCSVGVMVGGNVVVVREVLGGVVGPLLDLLIQRYRREDPSQIWSWPG